MHSVNKVILIGNVGQTPAISYLNNKRMASFTLATNESRKGSDGEWQKHTQWHKIIVYNEKLVDVIEKHAYKGSKLYVEGSYKSREYQDKQSNTKTIFEVVLGAYGGTIVMLDKEDKNNELNQTQAEF